MRIKTNSIPTCFTLASFLLLTSLAATPSSGPALPGVGNGLAAPAVTDEGWATAAARWCQLSERDSGYYESKSRELAAFLDALPDPSEWSAVTRTIATMPMATNLATQRRDLLVLLMRYQQGDPALLDDLNAAQSAPSETGTARKSRAVAPHAKLANALLAEANAQQDPESIVIAFDHALEAHEPMSEARLAELLGGADKATQLRAFLEDTRQLQIAQLEARDPALTPEARRAKRAAVVERQQKSTNRMSELSSYLTLVSENEELRNYFMAEFSGGSSAYVPTLEVPDLVTLVGKERAEPLLRRALVAGCTLSFQQAEPTVELVRRLTLELKDEIQHPSWTLLEGVSPDLVPLFEALELRFPATEENDWARKQAELNHLVSLVLVDRPEDALTRLDRLVSASSINSSRNANILSGDTMEAIERVGYQRQLWSFLHLALTRHPELDEWDRFTRLSAELEKHTELLALVSAAAETAGNAPTRLRARHRVARAQLALGDHAVGVAALKSALDGALTPETLEPLGRLALDAHQAADLLADEPLRARALAVHAAVVASLFTDPEKLSDATHLIEQLATQYRLQGHPAAALALFSSPPLALTANAAETENYQLKQARQTWTQAEFLAAVAAEAWDRAATLLNTSPDWDAADQLDIIQHYRGRDFGLPLAELARRAEDPVRQRRTLEAALLANPGHDPFYAAYTELLGDEALPLLRQLAASDAYEERPLIWQGELAASAARWDEARQFAQAAIAIDPSDGEQGPGLRMRVYALMERIETAQGHADKAIFFAGVVDAIRQSEAADRWHDAGFYGEAIRRYRAALDSFADAYCIQSRIAIRLAEQGKMEEALVYYAKAYELMPDSFGRVESHCFGCERAFAGERAQGLAERTFVKMLAARPDKPQLHYLLGYLRDEQARLPEAAAHYRRAVELDPLYLNAWKKLAALESRIHTASDERETLALTLLSLDPLARHSSPDYSAVRPAAKLWTALQAARAVQAAFPQIDQLAPLVQRPKVDGDGYGLYYRMNDEAQTYGHKLLSRPFVKALLD